MTPRELQDVILNGPHAQACAPYVHTNDMPKISGAAAVAKDQAIADILNADPAYGTSVAVPAWVAKKLLVKRGKWRAIVLAANNEAHPAVDAAYSAVALAEDARMDADFLDPLAAPLLAALVDSALITSDDRAALEALCRRPPSFAAADISRALRGPWE